MNQEERKNYADSGKKNNTTRRKKKKRRASPLLTIAWGAFGAIVVALIVVCVLMFTLKPTQAEVASYIYNSTFCEGITVNGKDISGLTYNDAWALLKDEIKTTADDTCVSVNVGTGLWVLSAQDLGLHDNLDEVLKEAIALGRSDTFFANMSAQSDLKKEGKAYTISYSASEEAISKFVANIEASVNTPAVNASMTPDKTATEPTFNYHEGDQGFGIDADVLVKTISDSVSAGKYNVTFTPELVYTEPDITIEDLQSSIALRSSFQTHYGATASLHTAARMRNIQKAARILNGCVVEPGAELSFNEFIGPRYEKDGWALAPGIVNGSRYENQAGGGICQVSTTLYDALLQAGPEIEIIERNRHSWPSSYTDYGLDATVSTGGPDLKFKNNTNAPLYIFAYEDNVNYIMTVYIYGEPLPDGVTYEIEGITEEVLKPGKTEYIEVPTWPTGYSETYVSAREGYRATAYRYKLINGERVETEVLYTDIYGAVTGQIKIGTGDPRLPKPNGN